MEKQIFEQIKVKCQHKKIVSLCNKLSKKLSFKNKTDVWNLQRLAYWLYICEEKEFALNCVNLTQDLLFDGNYDVWTPIHLMWGLKIRLLREQYRHDEAKRIADTINGHLLTPSANIEGDSLEWRQKFEEKRRLRSTFERVIEKEEIESCIQNNDNKGARSYMESAESKMIGLTETGLYPLLNEHKEQIEDKLVEYVTELTKG